MPSSETIHRGVKATNLEQINGRGNVAMCVYYSFIYVELRNPQPFMIIGSSILTIRASNGDTD